MIVRGRYQFRTPSSPPPYNLGSLLRTPDHTHPEIVLDETDPGRTPEFKTPNPPPAETLDATPDPSTPPAENPAYTSTKPAFWMDEAYPSVAGGYSPFSVRKTAPLSISEVRALIHKYQTTSARDRQFEAAILTINRLLREAAEHGQTHVRNFAVSSTGPHWREIIKEIVQAYEAQGFEIIQFHHHDTASNDILTFQIPLL